MAKKKKDKSPLLVLNRLLAIGQFRPQRGATEAGPRAGSTPQLSSAPEASCTMGVVSFPFADAAKENRPTSPLVGSNLEATN